MSLSILCRLDEISFFRLAFRNCFQNHPFLLAAQTFPNRVQGEFLIAFLHIFHIFWVYLNPGAVAQLTGLTVHSWGDGHRLSPVSTFPTGGTVQIAVT
jgi:hypothetical protein